MATAWTWTKMGDMNRDRELTSMDALMILQTAAGNWSYRQRDDH